MLANKSVQYLDLFRFEDTSIIAYVTVGHYDKNEDSDSCTAIDILFWNQSNDARILIIFFLFPDPAKRMRGAFAYIGLLTMLVCSIIFALNLLKITNL